MSLRNSLYYPVGSREADSGRIVTVRFDESHPIFKGHFPGHPVVPGVCLVQIAEELLSDRSGHSVRFTAVRNLKFRQPVTPDMEVTFLLTADDHTVHVQINDYAQFRATYLCVDSDL